MADTRARTTQLHSAPSDDAASRRGMAPARLDDDRSELPLTTESGLSPVPSGLSLVQSGVSQVQSSLPRSVAGLL